MSTHKERVLALFEKHRASPGAPFEADHFLDFLLPGTVNDRAVYNSFRGLRRFNAFLDELQLEFAICFSLKDREANYSLDRFVARVQELQQSRRSSLASLNNQLKIPVEGIVVGVNVVLVSVLIAFRDTFWVAGTAAAAALWFNIWYYRLHRKEKIYLKSLRARIQGHEQTVV